MDIKAQDIRKTELIIENHLHGAFGVDFNYATADEILECSKNFLNVVLVDFSQLLLLMQLEILKNKLRLLKRLNQDRQMIWLIFWVYI